LSTGLGTANNLVINSSGYIGLGTTSPAYRIDIHDSSPSINLNNDIAVADGSAAGSLLSYSGSTYLGAIQFWPQLGGNGASINFRQRVSGSNTNAMTINNGVVGIGTTQPKGQFNIATSNGNQIIYFDTYDDADASHTYMRFRKSNSDTIGTLSPTVDGEAYGQIDFYGVASDSSQFAYGASIKVYQNGTVGTVRAPADIRFMTSPGGTTTALDRMSITKDGYVGIGITNPAAELSISDGTDTFDFDVSTNALKILTTTSDGSDDQRILINAGADGESSTRGAYISLNGNEYTSNPGKAILQSGNFGGAGILFRGAGGVDMMFMSSSGDFGVGTITPADKVHIADSSATDFRALTLRNSSGTTDSAVVLGFEASAGTLGDDAALAAQIKGVRLGSGTNGALSF
jgi:hypothetical protein